jgi:glutathione S-transferase
LKEKNLSYEIIPISLAEKANTTPEYLERQPFGQVPVLDDNGYHIYGEGYYEFVQLDLTPIIIFLLESRAIGRYIALKYASQGTQDLIPVGSDLEATGRFEEACSVEYSQFNPSAEGLAQELIFKK